jgi:hypothetical protein
LEQLIAVPMDHVGPSRFVAVVGLLGMRKNSNKVGMQFLSFARHKNWEKCGVVSLALYLWRRFERKGESFPAFHQGRKSWYGTKVLTNSQSGSDKKKSIAYSTEATQIAIVLKKEGIKAHKLTHFFRDKGAEQLEYQAEGLLQDGQTERLGGWNLDVMKRTYQNGLPMQAVMLAAGHPATHFNSNYHIAESPDSNKPPTEILRGLTKLWGASRDWIEFARLNPDATLEDGMGVCGASVGFASLCEHLAEVLVETAPFIQMSVPNHDLFRTAPFNKPDFAAYANAKRASVALSKNATPALAVEQATALLVSPLRRGFSALSAQVTTVSAHMSEQLSTLRDQQDQQQQQQPTTLRYEWSQPPPAPLLVENGPLSPPPPLENTNTTVPTMSINLQPTTQPVGRLSRALTSVTGVWDEKTKGVNGQPSIDSLIAKHGDGWHSIGRDKREANAEKGFKSKRNTFWKEIARLAVEHHETEDLAVVRLQARFAEGAWATDAKKKKLNHFKDVLDAEAKARKTSDSQ